MAIKYKGDDLPSYVFINDIKDMLLPPSKSITAKVTGRDGSYRFGNEIGDREITVDFTILATNEDDLRIKARDFAAYLFSEKPDDLVILAEPDKTYKAIVEGEVNIDEILHVGKGTVKFLCVDPYAYSAETTNTLTLVGNDGTVNISGNMPVFPQIGVTFTANTEEFLISSGDRYMYFGSPPKDGQTTGTSGRVLKADEQFNSGASLTSGSGIAVEGGTVPGDASYSFTGSTMVVGSYGTVNPSGWFGPCVIRAFDDASTATDFSVTATIGMDATNANQRGRIEFYLLDNTNTIFGKFAITDFSLSDNPYLVARVGTTNTPPNGNLFVNYTGRVGRWANFYGDIGIKRINNVWTFSAYNKRSGKTIDSFTYNYTDGTIATGKQLAKIAIHVAAKYTATTVIPTMYIDRLRMYNENQTNPSTQYEYAFVNGDTLDIDCNTGSILKNQRPFYNKLDPTSGFIKLNAGTNTISFYPPANISSPTITYKGRWR